MERAFARTARVLESLGLDRGVTTNGIGAAVGRSWRAVGRVWAPSGSFGNIVLGAFAIDTPNALFASMPNRPRFSRSRGVLFCASHESAAWTWSCRPCAPFGDTWVGVLLIAG